MGRLGEPALAALDHRLAPADAALAPRTREPGRQPLHTVYVPADAVTPDLPAAWGRSALDLLDAVGPPFDTDLRDRVTGKLRREPIEDLRVDFEDGYGVRPDADEDADAVAAVGALLAGPLPPFVGLRCKSLEAPTRRRAARTLDEFLSAWLARGPLPSGFLVTLPKVSLVAQVEAMVELCAALEEAHGLPPGRLRFEVQVETPLAVLGTDGTATVARLLAAAGPRCAGLVYGTYDYSAALGIAPAYQALDHPAADHAKAVLQVAAAATGVPVSDGSTNILPVGSPEQVLAASRLHARLVRRSLERGFYQGWDLHPGHLPTRFGATYAFFREGAPAAVSRLAAYRRRRGGGPVLDEPATARALAAFLRRGLDCGALDLSDVDVPLDAV